MIGTNRGKYEIFAISIFTNFNKPFLITTIESVTLMKYISAFSHKAKPVFLNRVAISKLISG